MTVRPRTRGWTAAGWFFAVAVGAALFEVIDALSAGSGSSLNGRPSGPLGDILLWLPVVSPGVAGLVAAWVAPPMARFGLPAAVAAVWARIGADRLIGALQGAQLPSETGVVLVLAFGLPWTLTAFVGGLMTIVGRTAFRRSRRLGRQS
ncbi:MAG TPA: hypothetical protein VKW09_04680 [bacterium]|nr:hypothetical protein [bacterium]